MDDDDGDSKSVNLGQNAITFGNFDFSFKNKNSTFQLRLQTLFRNQGDGFVAKSPHANLGKKGKRSWMILQCRAQSYGIVFIKTCAILVSETHV